MADDTDFAALYEELRITPDCTPEQFRHAYRRRVARLHPDQRGSAGDVGRLQELNRLYDAAMDFLRTHGRLPGAAHAAAAHAPAWSGMAADALPRASHAHDPSPPPKAGSSPLSRWFVLVVVLAIGALLLHAFDAPKRGGQAPAAATHASDAPSAATPSAMIELGMEKRMVRAIQGAPLGHHDIRWDYGPSWIEFKCAGVVTDWYSSPLRPLRVGTPHPSDKDWDRFDAARPAGC